MKTPVSAFMLHIWDNHDTKPLVLRGNETMQELDEISFAHAERIRFVTEMTHQGDLSAKVEFLARVVW